MKMPNNETEDVEHIGSGALLAAVLKWIDFDAQNLKRWFDECDLEGHHGNNTQQAYQLAYNSLVALRAKMRIELLSKPLPDGFDKVPEASSAPIYISAAERNQAHPQPGERATN